MSGEEEVRSSELKMGLSLSEDYGAFEVTSPFSPHKAWGIHCAPKEKDEKKKNRDRFQFPSSIRIRIPNSYDRVSHSHTNKVCFNEADFISGLCFLICPFIKELFFLLQLALA